LENTRLLWPKAIKDRACDYQNVAGQKRESLFMVRDVNRKYERRFVLCIKTGTLLVKQLNPLNLSACVL
jgi:hypothetical protein